MLTLREWSALAVDTSEAAKPGSMSSVLAMLPAEARELCGHDYMHCCEDLRLRGVPHGHCFWRAARARDDLATRIAAFLGRCDMLEHAVGVGCDMHVSALRVAVAHADLDTARCCHRLGAEVSPYLAQVGAATGSYEKLCYCLDELGCPVTASAVLTGLRWPSLLFVRRLWRYRHWLADPNEMDELLCVMLNNNALDCAKYVLENGGEAGPRTAGRLAELFSGVHA